MEDGGIPALRRFRGLESLDLLSGWAAGDIRAPIEAFYELGPQDFPRLRDIRVASSKKVDGSTLAWIGSFPTMTGVVIASCEGPSGRDLRALSDLQHLAYLRLGPDCPWLDQEAFRELAQFSATDLTLELGGNAQIEEEWVATLSAARPGWTIRRSRAESPTAVYRDK